MGLRAMAEDRGDRVIRAAYTEVARMNMDILKPSSLAGHNRN
jgi:hypothetical protein